MDAEFVRNCLMGINILLTIGFWLAASRDNKDKATISSINRIEENLGGRINLVENRISRVEQDMNHAPTHHDLGKVYDKLNEAIGEFREMRGEFRQSSKQTERLYQRLSELESGMDSKQ